MLPREHGSWALLAAPAALGLFMAPAGSPAASALFALGALGAFLSRVPLQSLALPRPDPAAPRWLAAYGGLAAAGFAPLILAYGRWALLAFGAAAVAALGASLALTARRKSLSWTNELLGVGGLALLAPAGYYSAHGRLEGEAWTAWALAAAFFSGPLFYVKAAALEHRAARDASAAAELAAARKRSVAYHAGTASLAVAAAAAGGIPWLAAAPFVLALEKAWRRAGRPPRPVEFKRLGWQEVGYAAAFLALALAGFRLE